jgi:ArsR family transcriptional regulator, arsenate/arsenite/antimonite-responsive transcriptional repressor
MTPSIEVTLVLDVSVTADMFGSMTELVAVAKSFADATRVRILAALRERELCVCELCDALQVTQSTLSTHLQVIREAGLVRTRRQGKWVYYALEPSALQLVESVFGFFAARLRADKVLRKDRDQIGRRLAERENGACCRGFSGSSRRKNCC